MLTQERVRALLDYDSESGQMFYKKGAGRGRPTNKPAGWRSSQGYKMVLIDGKNYRMHRVIWLYVYGYLPEQIDHVNHVRHDNRLCNLRAATNATNHMNRPMQANNTSGVVGVYWFKRDKKWDAQIKINGKNVYIGRFANKEDAVAARKQAEIDFGFHANHGKKQGDIAHA